MQTLLYIFDKVNKNDISQIQVTLYKTYSYSIWISVIKYLNFENLKEIREALIVNNEIKKNYMKRFKKVIRLLDLRLENNNILF